ncbi:hypothetical protein BDZ45DRAFT_422425 [Acephala macrosclerotiorum]|nr:hypothetical protein BDZ45DRAFT_422425 [Acephala macrosclerotiorum]
MDAVTVLLNVAMPMPYIRSCLVQLFLDRDSIFTHPLLRKYRISISATFPLLNVLDLLLSTIVSLLSVLGLLWHEIFRLPEPTARLFSSILMLQSPVVLLFSLVDPRWNPVFPPLESLEAKSGGSLDQFPLDPVGRRQAMCFLLSIKYRKRGSVSSNPLGVRSAGSTPHVLYPAPRMNPKRMFSRRGKATL